MLVFRESIRNENFQRSVFDTKVSNFKNAPDSPGASFGISCYSRSGCRGLKHYPDFSSKGPDLVNDKYGPPNFGG